ncbi:DUF4281 domain-containing protein [Methylobacterium sp. W2]|uniref:abscisic acid-deficient protein Aba4 family protein n=1 Tax=Methylobacterium sp. W2 TaxID=2598107 RepID=UPI001D0C650F|nr:abscisic acid-deficient protein Aba4 family protein [Methylobacterium sp. W2]MCC0806776.1 DUF4281 domain-containing protein [Methylobacterium sp. W2]
MISAASLFSLCSSIALFGWIALAIALFAPRLRRATWIGTGLVLPALLAVAYIGALAAGLAGGAKGGFDSIEAVRSLFADDHALTAGWIHYLAFDLFVGACIARAGTGAGLSPLLILPCLVLTFLVGPAGLLLALVIGFSTGRLGLAARA